MWIRSAHETRGGPPEGCQNALVKVSDALLGRGRVQGAGDGGSLSPRLAILAGPKA